MSVTPAALKLREIRKAQKRVRKAIRTLGEYHIHHGRVEQDQIDELQHASNALAGLLKGG